MIKVALEKAEFFSYHGFYPAEQVLGNKFIVDVEVIFDSENTFSDDKISTTVNYEELYHIVNTQMQHTRKLIETVAQAILNEISKKYTHVISSAVTIKKANPLIGGPVKHSVVTISYHKHLAKNEL